MIKKRPYLRCFIILFIVFAAFTCFGCATTGPVSGYAIKMEIAKVKKKIESDRSFILKLKDKRISRGGFFFIMDNEGRLVYHPQSLLVGRSFKDDWLISIIIKEKSGCLRYTSGNQELYIFYDRLNAGEIICLSIASTDLSSPEPGCTEATQNTEGDNEQNPPAEQPSE
jgi:hypothetical protein